MSQHILHGNPPVSVLLRRSARARRISLRVSKLDGRVTLTLPRGVPEREGLQFVRDKADWIRGNLQDRVGPVPVGFGAQIPVEGRMRQVRQGDGPQIRLTETELRVPGPEATAAARVRAWLRVRARDRLAGMSERHARAIGQGFGRITLRDTRSRWGSCTSRRDLMYSWRLIMAPPEVLDYVAAHEVAHLVEMNHSPAFWAIVEGLCPDFRRHRRWLRDHGPSLHAVQFPD